MILLQTIRNKSAYHAYNLHQLFHSFSAKDRKLLLETPTMTLKSKSLPLTFLRNYFEHIFIIRKLCFTAKISLKLFFSKNFNLIIVTTNRSSNGPKNLDSFPWDGAKETMPIGVCAIFWWITFHTKCLCVRNDSTAITFYVLPHSQFSPTPIN